jgi:hypothetical protein
MFFFNSTPINFSNSVILSYYYRKNAVFIVNNHRKNWFYGTKVLYLPQKSGDDVYL